MATRGGPLAGLPAGLLLASVAGTGCGLFADIGDLEYGTGGGASTSTTTAVGPGGTTTTTGSAPTSATGTGGAGQGGGGAGGESTTTNTTTTSSSDGGATGSGGEGGAGGVFDPGERCGNGVDDDDDDLVDCEDDECTGEGWACVEFPTEQGFSGQIAFAYGTPQDPPECASGWTEIARGGVGTITASPAECTACSCGGATGGVCNATFDTYADGACATLSSTRTASGNGATCVDAGDIAVAGFLGLNDESVSGATCPASGGVATVPNDAEFDVPVVICEMEVGAGCATGVCAPMPAAPFEPTRCVVRTSGGNCNAVAPFSDRTQVDTGIADGRGCTACTCGGVTGRTCTATTNAYAQDNCAGGATAVPQDGSCVGSTQTLASYMVTTAFAGGTCSPGGGAPAGSVDGDDGYTLCCQP